MAETLTAARTDCVTGKTREVTLTWEVRTKDDGETWLYLKGGVTGYESVQLDDYHTPRLREHGWLACAGTHLRWDGLFVAASELNRVLDLIERKAT